MRFKIIILFCFSFCFIASLRAQAPVQTAPADTTTPVEILPGTRRLEFRRLAGDTDLQILAGSVRLKQANTLFFCDSCVINKKANLFEAFGHVHIKDSDTANVYSKYLRYQTDKRLAHLEGGVKLTDGHATLTTPELDYDMISHVGTYTKGGKVVNKKSVLTSEEGVYYADLRDVYFKRNVELKDPAYYLKSDSLLYNTETQTARFIAETYIRDSSNRVIRTSEGIYDMKAGHSQFTKRTTITDKALTVIGDEIADDNNAGIVQIRGRGVMKDTAKGMAVLANEIFINKRTDAFLATVKPLMIIKQTKDSIFITADTLFSAHLSDLHRITIDTLVAQKDSANARLNDSLQTTAAPLVKAPVISPQKDSTDRYFEAFRHVRVFSDSVQAASDSLFYSFRDSTFRLFQNPVVWSNGSQITGDTIYLLTRNRKADRVHVFENSFLVKQMQAGVYNQVKSTRMDGYFTEGTIDSVRADGYAESIYFIQDKDSSYSGINQTTSDLMDVYFKKGDLWKVVFRNDVKGTLWPIREKQPSEMRLENFQWLEDRRPKTKYEMYQ